MEKLIKLFPVLPAPKDEKGLWLAIAFYTIAPFVAGYIIGAVLGMTIVLIPLAFLVDLAVGAYSMLGLIFTVLSALGIYDFTAEAKE